MKTLTMLCEIMFFHFQYKLDIYTCLFFFPLMLTLNCDKYSHICEILTIVGL